jgi:hypothetical protein
MFKISNELTKNIDIYLLFDDSERIDDFQSSH